MPLEIPLDTMTVAEKIQLLETVWDSLCGQSGDVRSPEWHEAVLAERTRRLDAGETQVYPWAEVKARLQNLGK